MYAYTQLAPESYSVEGEFVTSYIEEAVECTPITPVDIPQALSPDILTSYSQTPSESYTHTPLEYDFPGSYPMPDEHDGSAYTYTTDFIPSYFNSTTAGLAETTDSLLDLGHVDYTHHLPTYPGAQEELGASHDGGYDPYLPTLPASWDSQYAEELSPLTPTVPTLGTQLEDPYTMNPIIYTSSPSDTFPAYNSFVSSLDGSSNGSELNGWDWNLNPTYDETAGTDQFLQNNMALDCQPTFFNYPTTFYMKGGASLTIETTLKVSPVACRCGGNYSPVLDMNNSDYRQKSLEYY